MVEDAGYSTEFNELENRIREFPVQHKEHVHPTGNPTMDMIAKAYASVLKKIWGVHGNERVTGSNTLAFLAIFQIPEFIEAAHILQPNRYNEEDISEQIHSSSDSIAIAVGAYDPRISVTGEARPVHIRPTRIIYGQHHVGNNPPGIPNITMAYFMHEVTRASETLAKEQGVTLTPEDLEANYRYLMNILQCAGYSFPDGREEMGEIASEVDSKLSSYKPKTAELTDRLWRLSLREGHGLTLSTIKHFLRPASRDVFEKVAREYGL